MNSDNKILSKVISETVSFFREAKWFDPSWLLLFGAITAVGYIAMYTINFVFIQEGVIDSKDFVLPYTAATMAKMGEATNIYHIPTFLKFHKQIYNVVEEGWYFSYPPWYLIFLLPFTFLSPSAALITWLTANVAAFTAVISRMIKWQYALLFVIATPMSLGSIWDGQNGMLSATLLGLAVLCLEKRPVAAGIIIGLMSYKPHLGIIIPFCLIAGKEWKTFYTAAITVTILILVSVAAFGTEIWVNWFNNLSHYKTDIFIIHKVRPDATPEDFAMWYRVPTVFSAVKHFFHMHNTAVAVHALVAGITIGTVIYTWTKNLPKHLKGAVMIAGISLTTAHYFDYDMTPISFALAVLAIDGFKNGFMAWEKLVMVIVWILPVLMPTFIRVYDAPVAPLVLILFFTFAVKRAWKRENPN